MIVGIGTDIVEMDRIKKILEINKDGFLNKIFTDEELKFLEERNMRTEFVAGRYAAKEAVSKALGTGIRGFSFKDIQVFNDDLGKPYVVLTGGADEIRMRLESGKIHLSISHGRDNAIAYAILEEAWYFG